ncbi:MAG: helix-turn-helix transcriptional regulator, partial [Candidatus Aminicenantes bacterium]|nr:helix-turn-helix transcriptional regulator [Candidatus Aminicenantes bacterium]
MNDNSSVKTISLKVPGPPLRIIREILGLSQSEVAGLVRVSQAAISLYESGRRSPSEETRR